jgi:protocatechuate 3,4-dioxygenase beta subunit
MYSAFRLNRFVGRANLLALLCGIGVLIGVCVAWPITALAQETVNQGTISGRVLDQQETPVPGAEVSARQSNTNVVTETIADEEGRFRFPYLRIGPSTLATSSARCSIRPG